MAMHRIRRAAFMGLMLWAPSWPAPADSDPQSAAATPQALFQDLFAAVQDTRVFADGKSFPDAVPKAAPAVILEQYHVEHPASSAALKDFVAAHFVLPQPAAVAPASADQIAITQHIDRLWDVLTRTTPTAPAFSSLLSSPKPYVVPGGRFREMYYWDSYFTMLGLAQSGRMDLLNDMVADFAYFIDTFGHVPNGARTYYLSRSQPPFFFAMVGLTAANDPGAAYAKFLPQLKREYAFWMEGAEDLKPNQAHRRVVALPDGAILNRYWDDSEAPRDEAYREDTELAQASKRPPPQVYRELRAAAESGWDFSSRWFADGRRRETIDTTELIPVDLNSLLFGLENAIAAGCAHSGDQAGAREFKQRSVRRQAAVDRFLWNSSGAYFDYRWTERAQVPRLSAAALYPLFVAMASQQQAAAVAVTARRELLSAGGIVTTPLNSGQQWDAPNGWAPLQWVAIAGLRGYGETRLAQAVACRWLYIVNDVYRRDHKLVEKYDVVNTGRLGGGGEYPLQDGFGWTNGVTRKLLALYPAYANTREVAQCSS
jgi:alpha,alpha-trehalase